MNILAIDTGSSSCRAVVVTPEGSIIAEGRGAVPWKFPQPSWVEMDPKKLWAVTRTAVEHALAKVNPAEIVGVGITSHRESVVMWDRKTGEPVHDVVVWISQQTDDIIRRWDEEKLGPVFTERTGLRNDSFFSAGKVVWLLENVPGLRARAEAGEIALGTVDSWVLWNLTGGETHATDHSCASRTALFNLEQLGWDEELCARLNIPMSLFAQALPSDGDFGRVSADIIAQMADRCYLEKCRDRLYPEFLTGGLTQRRKPDGSVELVYTSGADLVQKTPNFYAGATKRLDGDLEGVHGLVEKHFGGQNLYLEELHKNIDFADHFF